MITEINNQASPFIRKLRVQNNAALVIFCDTIITLNQVFERTEEDGGTVRGGS